MKKKVLIIIFLPLFILAFSLPSIIMSFFQKVELVKLAEFTKENTVLASGKVEQILKSDVKSKIPLVFEDVLFDVGDNVKVGDTIAKVDVTKTKEAMMNISQMSDIIPQEVMETLSEFDFEKASAIIPNEIKSDFNGTITSMSLIKGKMFYPNETLATISKQNDNLRAKIDILESQIKDIKEGQEVIITPTFNDDEKYLGHISLIFPTAFDTLKDASKETVVNAYVDIEDPKNLKSGYNIDAKIKLKDDEIIKGVPYSAVNQDEKNREFVYVYKDNKAVKKYVETGYEGKDLVQIVNGIEDDDLIINNSSSIKEDNQFVIG